jgi:hypothetical protein
MQALSRRLESDPPVRYDSYRAGAMDCYLKEYEFSAHFDQVLHAIEGGKKQTAAWS